MRVDPADTFRCYCASCGRFFRERAVMTVANAFGPVTSCRKCAHENGDVILAVGMDSARYEHIRDNVKAAATIGNMGNMGAGG